MSNWRGLAYTVLAPGDAPQRPRVLLRGETGVNLATQPAFRVRAWPDGVQVTR